MSVSDPSPAPAPHYDVLIVGGGHGGAQAAIALRQRGFSGTLAIVGEERDPPYERPPLSKEYLAGDKPRERLAIRPDAFWAEREITLLTGRRVVAVDPDGRAVETADGRHIGYGELVWAAGGHARRLTCAGADLAGVHAIRTRADVDALRSELPGARRVCVVGGGYVGLEAAAVLTGLGLHVTVLEAAERVLARVAGRALSDFYAAEHRARGVDVRLGAAVTCIEGDVRATGVRLAGGEVVPCDVAIVGVGLVPSVEPLLAAGAEGGNGVLVDAHGRTSLAGVYAIGDCALQHSTFAGGAAVRIESVANAHDGANAVARAITGEPQGAAAPPWFWSNQYDLKLQTVGLSPGHDAEVLRGDPAARSFSVIYLRGGRVVALDCVNAVKDYVAGKALVMEGAAVAAAELADVAMPLKRWATAARGR